MYSKNDDPAAGDGRPPSRFKASGLRSRHLAAHVLVAVWVVLALLAASAQQTLPVARWLAIHLFLLGGATTAIVVWNEHFAVAILHAPLPDRRWSNARLVGVNTGVAGVLTGVWADLPVLTGAGCALLVTAVGAHVVVLVRMGRGALGGRLAPIADYYRAAAAALIVGGVLGWLLATGKAVVMLAAAGHGIAHAKGRADLARALAVVSLVGSLGVVLLATALPAT